jgi:hypothetical protein
MSDLADFIRTARGLAGLDGWLVNGSFACPVAFPQTPEGMRDWEKKYGVD